MCCVIPSNRLKKLQSEKGHFGIFLAGLESCVVGAKPHSSGWKRSATNRRSRARRLSCGYLSSVKVMSHPDFLDVVVNILETPAKPPSSPPPWRGDGGSELAAAESKAAAPKITPANVRITPANPLVKPSSVPPPAAPSSAAGVAEVPADDPQDDVVPHHEAATAEVEDEPQSLEDTLQLMLRSCESDDVMILGLHYLVLVVTIESDESGHWLVVTQTLEHLNLMKRLI
eukprot:s5059_g1.t1